MAYGCKVNHKVSIYAVYVSTDKRGFGIGRQLMIEIINMVRLLEGIEQLNLAVVSTNGVAKCL